MLITEQNKPSNLLLHFNQFNANESIVVLKEDAVAKSNSFKYEVEVIAVKLEDRWINTEGKAILYLAKDSLSSTLLYADKLAIKGSWKVIPIPTNPAQFDYIIISEKAKLDLTNINCKQVIIDSSVPYYRWEKIKKECHKWGIPFYNVNTQDAYLFEFI